MDTKIFISHGHNEIAMHKLKDFVRDRLHMEAVVLSEQPDLGLTIVEKLEHYGKACQFALILLTADDETKSGGLRARQNVIHELGYFHGVLGRKRVLLLKEGGIELFSNISGLIYKEFPAGSIESVFEDIRLAIQSNDASQHAKSVPIQSESDYTKGDWIAAAIVGPENAETKLKQMVGRFLRLTTNTRSAKIDQIIKECESEISALLKKYSKGGKTDETRLEALIAKVMSDILQREIANFQWNVEERSDDDPAIVFRDTVKAFIENEKNKWKK